MCVCVCVCVCCVYAIRIYPLLDSAEELRIKVKMKPRSSSLQYTANSLEKQNLHSALGGVTSLHPLPSLLL